MVPDDLAELPMKRIWRTRAADSEQTGHALLDGSQRFLGSRMVRTGIALRRGRQVVGNRVGQDEVTIRQPLHEGRGAEAIGPVVGKIGFSTDEKPGIVLSRL